MTEEESKKPEEKEEKPETTPAEDKARSNGWSPADNWKGPEEDWVDYKEFNLRGELMGRINEQSSIINHLQNKVTDRDKALDDMSELQTKISEREYKKALNDLLGQKKEAMEADDYDGVVNLDEEISSLKEHKPIEKPKPTSEGGQQEGDVPQEIIDWLSKPEQSWYHTDVTMRTIAEGFAAGIQADNPNILPADLIKKVNSTMRKELPHKFKQGGDPGVDEGGEFNSNSNKSRSKGKSPSFSSLTEEQQTVCKRFERIGTMTRKEYIESLVEIGEA